MMARYHVTKVPGDLSKADSVAIAGDVLFVLIAMVSLMRDSQVKQFTAIQKSVPPLEGIASVRENRPKIGEREYL
jgi:hypothetical protein